MASFFGRGKTNSVNRMMRRKKGKQSKKVADLSGKCASVRVRRCVCEIARGRERVREREEKGRNTEVMSKTNDS